MTSYAEKYRPKSYKELISQDQAAMEVQKFIKEFPKKKAILLHGVPGTGKTSLALAAAKENNMEIFELNSSDLRNRTKLEEILKPASEQQSLFKKGKILLMDEVDGVTGTDIGGVPELVRIIEKTSHPLILTGNDIWQSKFSKLRPKCKLVELKPLKIDTIARILKIVCEKEGIQENEHYLRQIAIKSQGDVRAALNDLQFHSASKGEDMEYLETRNQEQSIFNILKLIFQERQPFLNVFDNTSLSLDEILLWIEENIPREYQNQSLYNAFLALSNADKFRGRIYRQQFWRFLVYQGIFQSAGISFAKPQQTNKFTKYERPKRVLKIWLNNQKTVKKKTIAQKYAKLVHCSVKRAMKDFNLVKNFIKTSPKIQGQLKLNQEEIDFLGK
ncbi:hypothetical protein CO038_01715 [Candidatus Pacearchaeota archaeon CG_4_9_14_0_2_um_filter_39_13]|nr:replication factor C large subunit [Candidatus Pacearchaeota archaeon]OIO42473.1 MAG: hypothetical protein AUJ64_04160 [Candidatus Pacearchaeota archaeon CG1_02_39_14]PJC44846.1 MAG: hypothetical protein CO038_01715 [Candidatus Pacearchaeota archaeon CG_4_9_14_0_2_um_filter_39_13]